VGLIVDEWLGKSEVGKSIFFLPIFQYAQTTFILIFATAEEERDFEHIRRTYLPEMILDYHNALYYASHSLDKPNLLTQCMTVSIWVANNTHLTRSFTEAQRMSELVDCIALAGKAMVLADPKNDQTFTNGQTLGLWRISVSEDDEAALLQNRE
jgi:nuclear pore complex protein Nup107